MKTLRQYAVIEMDKEGEELIRLIKVSDWMLVDENTSITQDAIKEYKTPNNTIRVKWRDF